MTDGSAVDWTTAVTVGAAALAACGVGVLTAASSDTVSRRILSPERTHAKRSAEYGYRWRQAMERAVLQCSYVLAGGVGNYNDEIELAQTKLVRDMAHVELLVQAIVDRKGRLRIGKICTDERMPSTDYYVWLYDQESSQIYQLPLTTFGMALADAMERKIHSTTFCFLADAAASTASALVKDLLQITKSAVEIYENSLWLTQLALLTRKNLHPRDELERVLYAFCRMQAWNCEQPTLLISYGAAVTPILLPMLQQVFPDDRHLFCYTGCIQTAQAAFHGRRSFQRNHVPECVSDALQFPHPVSYTTPLSRSMLHSVNTMPPYSRALVSLPIEIADVVETWMAAVDAFFLLKEDERINGYLPYVLKTDYLLTPVSLDVRHWTTRSLLQYVCGSRTRGEVPSETLDAAFSYLRERKPLAPLAKIDAYRKPIENAVFQHKLILIENKTLQDTVQPTQHWTLKSTAKAGCACCLPEEDEEDEDLGALKGKLDMSRPGVFVLPGTLKKGKPSAAGKFVDGKMGFAFDPTKFS
jgi:hypothetical protein